MKRISILSVIVIAFLCGCTKYQPREQWQDAGKLVEVGHPVKPFMCDTTTTVRTTTHSFCVMGIVSGKIDTQCWIVMSECGCRWLKIEGKERMNKIRDN